MTEEVKRKPGAKFMPGDVVKVRSGGPSMTVEEVMTSDSGAVECRTIWVDENHEGHEGGPCRACFRQDVLEHDES